MLHRAAFTQFIGLVPDIRRRLKRLGEMRRRHAEAHDAAHGRKASQQVELTRSLSMFDRKRVNSIIERSGQAKNHLSDEDMAAHGSSGTWFGENGYAV